MSAAERLLERLEGVKRTGPDRWVAQCPAHGDRNPSLSVRETGDRLLLHCWAGCEAAEVVNAVGLRLADLFEQPLQSDGPIPARSRWDRRDAWRCLWHEALIAALVASDAARGQPLSQEDAARAALAAERLGEVAATFGPGGHS